jgi:PAS domain S-box-containing protein
MHNYHLSDLLDISLIQKLADSNFRASGLPLSIIDEYDTSVILRAGWTDICVNFHRACPASQLRCIESDSSISDFRLTGEPEARRYKCKNGLWHVAIPVVVAGKHLATMFLAQFIFEGEIPDREYFSRQALEFGYDQEAYLAALDKLPVFSVEKVDYIVAYDKALVHFIADLAEQSLKFIETKKSLTDSEEKYRTLVNNIRIGVFRNTPGKGRIYANPAMAEMFGYHSIEEFMGSQIIDEYENPHERARLLEAVKRNGFVKDMELAMRKKDGTLILCSCTATAHFNEQGEFEWLDGIIEDITERKRVEIELRQSREELRSLSAHLQSAREEERERIAREIHDELGQILSKLKLDIAWLKKRLTNEQGLLIEKSDKMSDLVDSTIRAVQRISSELRPGVLDYLGLPDAIEWQAKEFKEQTGIGCTTSIPSDLLVDDKDISTAVFRIFQETLTNIIRHSKASQVDVVLKKENTILELDVQDNGVGILDEKLVNHGSFGLMGMRERARFLGGKVIIAGVPGKGTAVLVRIPLDSKVNR